MNKPARTRLSGAERQEQLLEAAADLVRRDGPEALTMEGLAAASGVTKALPYRYFANRDAVLLALYRRQNLIYDDALAHAMRDVSDLEGAMRALVAIWSDMTANGNGIPALNQARTADGELEAEVALRTQASVRFIAELISTHGGLPRTQAMLAASVLLAGSRGLAHIWEHTTAPRSKLNETFVRMSLGAVDAIAPGAETRGSRRL